MFFIFAGALVSACAASSVLAGGEPVQTLVSLRGGAFERAFYSTVLPYHETGAAMSRLALERTKDPQIKTWATEVLDAQAVEIELIRAGAEEHGGVDRLFYDAVRDDMSRMLQSIAADRDFVEQMIAHHESEAAVVRLVPGRTEDPKLLDLAARINERLSAQLEAFRAWR